MDERPQKGLDSVDIGPLCPSDVDQALAVLARGMQDNPNHVAVLGDDPAVGHARLQTFLKSYTSIAEREVLVARDGTGKILGVMAMTKPGDCQLPSPNEARTVSGLYAEDPEATFRLKQWLDVWREHDPQERHWHCGPFAVDTRVQRMGIGSGLLRVFCAQLDAGKENAYLETDMGQSVAFFERFGFEVADEDKVLGATNWFMLRRPRAGGHRREEGIPT
jgi:ribosomal protein S18 acetylase RimI-like enzyme